MPSLALNLSRLWMFHRDPLVACPPLVKIDEMRLVDPDVWICSTLASQLLFLSTILGILPAVSVLGGKCWCCRTDDPQGTTRVDGLYVHTVR